MRYERDAITMLVYARNSIVEIFTTIIYNLSILQKCNVLHFEKFSISFRTFHIFLLLASQQSLNCEFELFLRFQYQCVRKENNSLSLSNERNFVPYPCHTTRSGFFLCNSFDPVAIFIFSFIFAA